LLEAFARIPPSQLNGWRLVIVGPAEAKHGGGGGDFLARLRRLAEPVEAHVGWNGPEFDPERLAACYERAAIFVYPSLAELGEASPLAPLEAMSAGCPALVSDLACFHDYIADSVDGFVFDHRAARPAEALAEKLVELMADPSRLRAVGQRAQAKSAEFAVAKIASLYLDDFRSLSATP